MAQQSKISLQSVDQICQFENRFQNSLRLLKNTKDILFENEIDQKKYAFLGNIKNACFENTLEDSLIYIIEDNSHLRSCLRKLIGKYYNIKTFEKVSECLFAMKDEWPSLIICNLLLSECNGIILCEKIKNNTATSHIPIILLSDYSDISLKIEALHVGADAYIHKPFNSTHILSQINALLLNRKKLKERFQIDFPCSLNKKPTKEADIQFVKKLYALFDECLDDYEINIEYLYKKLFMNRTHFFKKVKAITNKTPYELIKAYRLKKAAEILVNEDMNVSEVYMCTGFKSRTHFSKIFKDHYGVSPGKYGKNTNADLII